MLRRSHFELDVLVILLANVRFLLYPQQEDLLITLCYVITVDFLRSGRKLGVNRDRLALVAVFFVHARVDLRRFKARVN